MLKGKVPLFIALGLGLLAGVTTCSAIRVKEMNVRRGWNLVTVVVASTTIPEGTVVTADMISQRDIPEQFVTQSVVRPETSNLVLNQEVLVTLQPGDPLLWSQFATSRTAEKLSTKVQKKGRAITIDAANIHSVGGWVRPNDHVDIIGTFRDPATNENTAVTLLQNVIVLATGKITGTTNVNVIPEAQRAYNNVTLLVLPEEAEILVLASELGSLSLSLRNEGDIDTMEERGRATIHTLLSGERTRALQEKRREIIQIIKGSGSSPTASPGPR